MNISFKKSIPGLKSRAISAGPIHLLLVIATIVIISQSYRIFMKSSDFLLSLRVSEDYLLILMTFLLVVIKGRVQLLNLIPFALLFSYACLNFMGDFEFEFLRRYVIIMFWYIVAINAVSGIKPFTLLTIICTVGIFSAIAMIVDTERTLISYLLEGNRIHAEGEGIDMNINNIALILVSFLASASVLEQNIGYDRFARSLVYLLFFSVGIVLLVASTRSALLFYLLLVLYRFFSPSFKSILILLISIVFIGLILSPFYDQLVFINRTINQDLLGSERILSTFNSLEVFSYNPFIGVGETELLEIQMMEIGSTDHNFYTKLLGSNGIIGFVAVMIFFCGLIKGYSKTINGLLVLQILFCYSFVFSPAGPGSILIAMTIFYLKELELSHNLNESRLKPNCF